MCEGFPWSRDADCECPLSIESSSEFGVLPHLALVRTVAINRLKSHARMSEARVQH